jgi:hypothetical protein
VERFFGVLQARFPIIRQPGRIWDRETLALIMRACVIIHNMIVEDERVVDPDEWFPDVGENVQPSQSQATAHSHCLPPPRPTSPRSGG